MNAPMLYSYKLRKYTPSRDDWTSIGDVGKGLTMEAYLAEENRYIRVIQLIIQRLSIEAYKVQGLETYRKTHRREGELVPIGDFLSPYLGDRD